VSRQGTHRPHFQGWQSVLLSREHRKRGDKAVRQTASGQLPAKPRRLGLRRQGRPFPGGANAIHAFREGNSRSQLTFFALLADYAGHPIDLDELDPDKMLDAMIVSFDGDETKLANVVKSLIR